MKKLLDINTWIALSLDAHPQHAAARAWYGRTPLHEGDLLFCRQTELGFLRLITQERTMKHCGVQALGNDEAVDFLADLCGNPAVSRADEPSSTWELWLKLAKGPQPSPNVWMDAYLAAFAIAFGAEMVTFDLGFKSYTSSGLRLVLLPH